jgi:hypothetical protein
MPGRLAKTVRIFVEIDHIKTRVHILSRKNQTDISHAMEFGQDFGIKLMTDP